MESDFGNIKLPGKPSWEKEMSAFVVNKVLERRATDLEDGFFQNVQRSYRGDIGLYVQTMRAFVLADWETEKAQKARLTLRDKHLEFECDVSVDGRKSVRWWTRLPTPSWYFTNDEEDSDVEFSNSRINKGDVVTLTWRLESAAEWEDEESLGDICDNLKCMVGKVVDVNQRGVLALFKLGADQQPPDYRPPWSLLDVPPVLYTITFSPVDVVYRRAATALDYLEKAADSEIRAVILGDKRKTTTQGTTLISDASFTFPEAEFAATPVQTEAVNRGLAQSVTLIQGPPGCGKTAVIAAFAVHLLATAKDAKHRILVCGTSNVSVENLVRVVVPAAMGAGKKAVWLATKTQDKRPGLEVSPEHRALVYQQMLKRDTRQGRLFRLLDEKASANTLSGKELKQLQELRDILERQICKEADVVCCTLVTAGRRCLEELRFQTVVIDESTQALEPTALIPLIHGCTKLVLVGDQNQLGPVLETDALRRTGYQTGIFKRLISVGLGHTMLDCQFRMHPAISEFPNQQFYHGRITDGITADQRTGPPVLCFPSQTLPLLFWNLNGTAEKKGTSWVNKIEADAVETVVRLLLSSGVEPSAIGVITPYRGQTDLLRRLLPPFIYPRMKIASVDSFQGGERDYIVMSCVRSGGQNIGFLTDDCRLNVSLTRARFGLAIIGNARTLSSGRTWRLLCDHYEAKGAMKTEIPRIRVQRAAKTGLTITIVRNSALAESVESTDVTRMPASLVKSGLNLQDVVSPITGSKTRVMWPGISSDMEFLADWVQKRLAKLQDGRFVTVAFDTESFRHNPLCLQIGEVFNDGFDPFSLSTSVPPVGIDEGFIVFCVNKDGSENYEPVSAILIPLFTDERVAIATFDFTQDLANLEQIGVVPLFERVLDAQLYHRVHLTNLMTNTKLSGLATRIAAMELDDPILPKAKDAVSSKDNWPWDANGFICELDNLSARSIVTQDFLEYAASDIWLTGLALAEVARNGGMEDLIRSTQAKVNDYMAAKLSLGPRGAYLLRQAAFLRMECAMLEGPIPSGEMTDRLLQIWSKLRAALEVQEASDGKLLRIRLTNVELKAKIDAIGRILCQDEHLRNVRFLARVLPPPLQ
jgi:hypothetical protein